MGGAAQFCLSNVTFGISQEHFDFLRFSRSSRRQRLEVFEETSCRETHGAKIPFDNLNPENYLGDMGSRNAAARFACPVTGAQGVEDALRGDFDLRLRQGHSTRLQTRQFS
ncbi:MAG TPA: hypothetical protein VNW25_06700 [Candidatus Sulfotelmatobacter sp.]|nr:hypothetical protein [Candidatus Sulfotelmatobacter sp.]